MAESNLKEQSKTKKTVEINDEEDEELDFDFDIKPTKASKEVKPSGPSQPKKSMLDIAKKIEIKAREESKEKNIKK